MLQITIGADTHHFADSIVTLRPLQAAETLTVIDVPFGMGYAWEGVQTRQYRGEMSVLLGPHGGLDVVNVLGTEDVLRGVVPGEMHARAPEQALRAQAIAARNFVVTGLSRRHGKDPFDFCAEQHCQVYQGVTGEQPQTTAAVVATRGEVLMHGHRFVQAKYSARCGGHTENNEVVWPEAPDPALRGRSDLKQADSPQPRGVLGALLSNRGEAFCDPPGASRVWEKAVSAAALKQVAQQTQTKVGALVGVHGEGRGPGGRLGALVSDGHQGQLRLERELPIRRAFGNLRSGAFDIETHRDARGDFSGMTLRGVGWGHGVGLCQQGAMGRARAGHSCGAILNHYFNGAHVVPLWSPEVVGCPSREALKVTDTGGGPLAD